MGDFAESVAAAQSHHFALEKKRMREEIERTERELAEGAPVHRAAALSAYW